MPDDDVIELLLNFAQQAGRIYAGEVPVHVLVNDLDEGQKLSNGQIRFHLV